MDGWLRGVDLIDGRVLLGQLLGSLLRILGNFTLHSLQARQIREGISRFFQPLLGLPGSLIFQRLDGIALGDLLVRRKWFSKARESPS